MNQKARATAHVVGGRRIQVVAVRHALEGVHVAQSVRSLRQRANADLTLARRIIAARTRLAAAASVSVDVRPIVSRSVEVVVAHRVSVRSAGGDVQFRCGSASRG